MVKGHLLSENLGIELPLIQAPMAGSQGSELAIAASQAGGMGSLPCAMLSIEMIEQEVSAIRKVTKKPFNLNFFCHKEISTDDAAIAAWRQTLSPYYEEFNLDTPQGGVVSARNPFNESFCELVETLQPPVVSFHFGLPEAHLLDRVKATGCFIMSSATTAEEALWLQDRDVDAIIAQGVEAGGHRGLFLNDDIASQPGTMALIPQIVDNVNLPVIAAGGIADSRGIKAAFALGADMVQIGTAFLFSNQANPNPLHLQALSEAKDGQTALTNIFSGRPARSIYNRVMREIGPMAECALPFPLAGNDLAALKKHAEAKNDSSFSSLWAGQSVVLASQYLGLDTSEIIDRLFPLVSDQGPKA